MWETLLNRHFPTQAPAQEKLEIFKGTVSRDIIFVLKTTSVFSVSALDNFFLVFCRLFVC
jgi:hypothetical protein